MRKVLALSRKSFYQAINSKIFNLFLFFGIGLILFSLLLESLTFTAKLKIVKDTGLASISVFTALIAVFLSGEAIVGELERKTIYVLFSKPINKLHFLIGNFIGIAWTTGLAIITTGTIFLIMLFLKHGYFDSKILIALIFMFLETLVIISFGIMFSSFSSSILTSVLFCLFFYALGHHNPQLYNLSKLISDKMLKSTIYFICFILPNLEYFNVREKVVKGDMIDLVYTLKVTGYAFCYISAMLILSYFLFRRREL